MKFNFAPFAITVDFISLKPPLGGLGVKNRGVGEKIKKQNMKNEYQNKQPAISNK